jgi:hypothetical protein
MNCGSLIPALTVTRGLDTCHVADFRAGGGALWQRGLASFCASGLDAQRSWARRRQQSDGDGAQRTRTPSAQEGVLEWAAPTASGVVGATGSKPERLSAPKVESGSETTPTNAKDVRVSSSGEGAEAAVLAAQPGGAGKAVPASVELAKDATCSKCHCKSSRDGLKHTCPVSVADKTHEEWLELRRPKQMSMSRRFPPSFSSRSYR